jgi:hypothetical protein
MQFDFKVTTWERVTVNEKDEQKVLDAIKDGTLTCSSDIYDLFENVECKILIGLEEQMTVEENGGSSTIEVIDADGSTIFSNGKN